MAPSAPCFFQLIINPTLQERKLKIPNKFVHEHGKGLQDTVRLSIPTGRCWDVKVKREADGSMWLHDGFSEFMKENSIGLEYFLVCKCDQESKFIVQIYDLTAAEITYKCRSDSERCDVNEVQMDDAREGRDDSFINVSNCKDSDESTDDSLKNPTAYEVSDDDTDDSSRHESGEEGADDGDEASDNRADDTSNNERVSEVSDYDSSISESSDEDTDDDGDDSFIHKSCLSSDFINVSALRRTTRCNLTRTKKQIIEGGLDTDRGMRSSAGSHSSPRDLEKETTTRAKKKKPMAANSFQVTLKKYQITNGMLRIPSPFARSYMSPTTAPMKLVDDDNKEWEVTYVHPHYREHDYVLSSGWRKFVRAKGLMVGDICVFKHIEGNEEVKLKPKTYQIISRNTPLQIDQTSSYLAMSGLVDMWEDELAKRRSEGSNEAKSKEVEIKNSSQKSSWFSFMKLKLPKMNDASISMLVESFSP